MPAPPGTSYPPPAGGQQRELEPAVKPPPLPRRPPADRPDTSGPGTDRAASRESGAVPPPPIKAPPLPPEAAWLLPPKPPPAAAAPTALPGYEPGRRRRVAVYQLAASLAAAGLFSTIPAVLDISEHVRSAGSPGISAWAILLLLAACLQIAYAVYMAQLPDWSTVRVASLLALGMATGYAVLLGAILLAGADAEFIQLLELEQTRLGNRAAAWCLLMLTVSCVLAYVYGRFSGRWRRAYEPAG